MESYTDNQQSENVRKTLISMVKRWNEEAVKEDCKPDIKTSSECIAWLEKQGGPKSINDANEEIFETVKDTSALDIDESKFKVGDWIVDEIGWSWRVTDVTDTLYIIQNINAYELIPKKELVEKNCRLWNLTIDAKPGDVLVDGENRRPFIFKDILYTFHPTRPVAYCGLDASGEFVASQGDEWWTCNIVTPSTPRERDLLFEKMNEAGYVWNEAEKTVKNVGKLISFVDEDKSNLQCVIKVWNRFRRGGEAGITPNEMEKLEEWLVSLQKSFIV